MKGVLQTVALVLATLLGVFLLWQIRGVVALFLVALALAAAMHRPAAALTRLGLPWGLAVVLAYLISLGLLGGLLYALGNVLVAEAQVVGTGFTNVWEQIQTAWPAGAPWQQFIAQQIPSPDEIYQTVQGALSLQTVQTGLGVTASLLEALSQGGLMLVLSIYWSIDRERLEHLGLSLLQAEARIRARTVWQGIEAGVGGHIRNLLLQLILAGLVLQLGYGLLGLDVPATLAWVAAVVWLIPLIGWTLGLIPVTLVGLLDSPLLAVAGALYSLFVFFALRRVVVLRLLDHRRYNPLLTVVIMIAMTDVLGILGLLLAVPVAAVIEIVLSELLTPSVVTAATSQPVALQFAQHEEQMAAIQAAVAAASEPLSPTQASLVERLARLTEEAEAVFHSPSVQTPVTGSLRVPSDR